MTTRYERLHSKDKQPDYRTPGERDRDRVLYTTALRRLAGVTQVVAAAEGHIFHNRLTHTLEVAQIARRLAQRLLREHGQSVTDQVGGIDPDVTETAALAHDLGHPPFGHIAEQELDSLVKKQDVSDGFEGNAQSFRILTKLALKKDTFPGLNLTRASLNATLKYPWTRTPSGDRSKKWGAYMTEERDFNWARNMCVPGDERTIEAEIMDWADDIAYSIHDVEDFYRAGLIPLDRLVSEDDEREKFLEGTFQRWRELERKPSYPESELREAFRLYTEAIPIREPYIGALRQRAAIRNASSVLIGQHIDAFHLVLPYPGNGRRVRIEPQAHREVMILKELPWYYVINNPGLATQQHGQRQLVRHLFEVYLSAAQFNRSVLSRSAKEQLEKAEAEASDATARHEARVRATADFVAGLTEDAALELHRRLLGVSPGRLTDLYIR